MAVIAFAPGLVSSVEASESVAAFNAHVRPLERAQGTQHKYVTHRLSILSLLTLVKLCVNMR